MTGEVFAQTSSAPKAFFAKLWNFFSKIFEKYVFAATLDKWIMEYLCIFSKRKVII